jgi:thiamine biosynthesis lipoprotein ApbE
LNDAIDGREKSSAGSTNAAAPSRFLEVSRCGVATSGDVYQYVVIDGTRYSHILDPRTGLGLTRHSAVTVVAPDGITADGLATAASVLGPDAGLKLVAKHRGVEAFIQQAPADQHGDRPSGDQGRKMEVFQSPGFAAHETR